MIAPRMLTISELSKSFSGRTLFASVSLQVNREDRIGLVGPNGAGKSTLFALILGTESPDTGVIQMQRGVRVGHLPQENAPVGDETVLELATAVTPELARLQRLLRQFENTEISNEDGKDRFHSGPVDKQSAHPCAPTRVAPDDSCEEQSRRSGNWFASTITIDDASDAIQPSFHEAQSRFEQLGGYQLEVKARKILAGLGFREKDFTRPAREMSGGWVMRAHLARLLVHEPDLLLLDEPTNHLDLESLLWFQEYLRGYPGGILMISHDREFLNELAGFIVEICQARFFRYRGNYDAYLEQREAQEEQLLAAWKNQQREIARLQRFVDRFRAKNTKASQAQSKLKQIERMEKVEAPQGAESTIDFAFPQPQRSGLKVIALESVRHAYGQNIVYDGLEFQAERGQRIVLVGPNGAGKSTLLKLLAGVLPIQSGARELGHNVKAGYYSQYRVDMLQPQRTVLEEAFDTPQRLTETFVRTVLGCFLFRGDDVFKKVSVLSGGEKSRLALVKLLLDPPNLLLMDEPTTHLDLASIDALLYALDQFEGTIILISHDVYFIRTLANRVVHIQNGRLTHYPGGYEYYLDKTAPPSAAESNDALPPGLKRSSPQTDIGNPNGVPSSGSRKEQKRLAAEQRQARSREARAQRELVRRLEREITALETRQSELTAELEKPETYQQSGRAVEINRELKSIAEHLPELTGEWESAATRLAEMEMS
ncbi:MAG: ABC-F family ATP-binding cassette domain-containing protein [Verrucomicrobia bacterium]|nr:ABC-F family ATP-binding cassette domain-containing protein [Verrucomicrobiota bacterium]